MAFRDGLAFRLAAAVRGFVVAGSLGVIAWLDCGKPHESQAAFAAWRDIHGSPEDMALRHLLTRFDGKPTILARETKMNRVTLQKKFARQ